MTREIKFRAWDKENRRMRPHEELYFDCGEFKNPTLMQYTGLKDKNGVEIYEGDVVRYLLPKDQQPDESMETYDFDTVEWDKENICYPDFLTSYGCDELEVIGNVYANPDLLTTT